MNRSFVCASSCIKHYVQPSIYLPWDARSPGHNYTARKNYFIQNLTKVHSRSVDPPEVARRRKILRSRGAPIMLKNVLIMLCRSTRKRYLLCSTFVPIMLLFFFNYAHQNIHNNSKFAIISVIQLYSNNKYY